MTFDYSRLRGAIVTKFKTLGRFAERVHVSRGWLSTVLTKGAPIRQDTILIFSRELGLVGEIEDYFFCLACQQNSDKPIQNGDAN